jgi:2-polyprenyl-3-methyl-5-hydroxy-6-metoxy-1,4-benzoquinol methylase
VTEDSATWEEARACGACGHDRWRPAGEVCGKRYACCLRCGVVRLYDRVAADRLHLLYAGYYPGADPSPAELRRQLANPTFAHRRRRLESAVPAPRRRILEIGCGDGNFLAHLRGHGWTVQGAEYDAETAALVARRHAIDVSVGDVADARPAGAPFPAAAAYHVLEHVYRPAEWLAAVRGMLEPGGILHLQVPNHASLTRRVTGPAWASLMFPQHVYFYSPRTLSALLRRAGFAPLRVTTWDPWHGPGTVAGSAVNQARRAATDRLPWTDALGGAGEGAPGDARAVRRPRLARRLLDALSVPLARAEALAGAGAVVDVVARVE